MARYYDRDANLSGAQSRNVPWQRVGVSGTTTTTNTSTTATTAKADVLLASVPENGTTTTGTNGRFFFDVNDALHALVQFVGTDAANETGTARLWGWSPQADVTGTVVSYSPTFLMDLAITLGAETGIASGAVLATEYYADTITVSDDDTGSAEVLFNLADSKAAVQFDCKGFDFIEAELDIGTAATLGMLYRPI